MEQAIDAQRVVLDDSEWMSLVDRTRGGFPSDNDGEVKVAILRDLIIDFVKRGGVLNEDGELFAEEILFFYGHCKKDCDMSQFPALNKLVAQIREKRPDLVGIVQAQEGE